MGQGWGRGGGRTFHGVDCSPQLVRLLAERFREAPELSENTKPRVVTEPSESAMSLENDQQS